MFSSTTSRNSDGSYSHALTVISGKKRDVFLGDGLTRAEARRFANELHLKRMARESEARAKRNKGVIECLTN
jgi:hypothetical protein